MSTLHELFFSSLLLQFNPGSQKKNVKKNHMNSPPPPPPRAQGGIVIPPSMRQKARFHRPQRAGSIVNSNWVPSEEAVPSLKSRGYLSHVLRVPGEDVQPSERPDRRSHGVKSSQRKTRGL